MNLLSPIRFPDFILDNEILFQHDEKQIEVKKKIYGNVTREEFLLDALESWSEVRIPKSIVVESAGDQVQK